MTDSEFEELVRKAIREPKWWDEITAQESGAMDVLAVLRQWNERVKADIKLSKLKVAEAEASRSTGDISTAEMHRVRREQLTWRRKAEGFQSIVKTRMDELSSRLDGPQQKRHPDSSVTAEHASNRAKYRQKLRLLAAAIYLHQSEEITDSDLYSLLDEVSIPVNDYGTHEYYDVTLRQAIEKGRLKGPLEEVRSIAERQEALP